jgi:hypothetical protein
MGALAPVLGRGAIPRRARAARRPRSRTLTHPSSSFLAHLQHSPHLTTTQNAKADIKEEYEVRTSQKARNRTFSPRELSAAGAAAARRRPRPKLTLPPPFPTPRLKKPLYTQSAKAEAKEIYAKPTALPMGRGGWRLVDWMMAAAAAPATRAPSPLSKRRRLPSRSSGPRLEQRRRHHHHRHNHHHLLRSDPKTERGARAQSENAREDGATGGRRGRGLWPAAPAPGRRR